MIAVFRSDASPTIGSGHIMRCMTLAEAFQKRDAKYIFAATDETQKTVPLLGVSGFEIIAPEQASVLKPDILIVDHYGLDESYETQARAWSKKIVVLDDLTNRRHDCDLLLDQTYGRRKDDYETLVPSGCRIVTGADYTILRPQFAMARPRAEERRASGNRLKRVLVAVGSTNYNNIILKIIDGFMQVTGDSLQIDIVLGSGASNLSDVRRAVSLLNDHGRHTATLHLDVQDMAAMMVDADLAIGAGGTTTWERCCLGLPTLMLQLADNQIPTIEALTKAGAIIPIGHVSDLTPEKMAAYFETAAASPGILNNLSRVSFGICDGKGLERVMTVLEEIYAQ